MRRRRQAPPINPSPLSTTEASPETLIAGLSARMPGATTRRCSRLPGRRLAEGGESTALEEIARRAGVGIGALYRHFPNRQALLEALYVNEVDEVCRSAAELDGGDPWEALNAWFAWLIVYLAAKQALASSQVAHILRIALDGLRYQPAQ
jgi:AcrR family transcriptional regulator